MATSDRTDGIELILNFIEVKGLEKKYAIDGLHHLQAFKTLFNNIVRLLTKIKNCISKSNALVAPFVANEIYSAEREFQRYVPDFFWGCSLNDQEKVRKNKISDALEPLDDRKCETEPYKRTLTFLIAMSCYILYDKPIWKNWSEERDKLADKLHNYDITMFGLEERDVREFLKSSDELHSFMRQHV